MSGHLQPIAEYCWTACRLARREMSDIGIMQNERFRRLSIEVVWVVLGQTTAILGYLIGLRILTELLAPIAYGKLALGMTAATLVNQTVLGPLGNGITRFYAPAQEQGALSGYLKAVRRLVLLATGIIFLLILFSVTGLLIARREEWIAIIIAALIFAILSGCNSILSGIQNAARQRSIVALHQGIEPWARFLVAAGLVIMIGATSTMAMVGFALALLLVLCSQYAFFHKFVRDQNVSDVNHERQWLEKMWHFSWPISIFGIFTWFQMASDRWALELFATTMDVGKYSALFQLGYYPISIASGMAFQLLAPIFYQHAGDASDTHRNAHVNELSWRLTVLALGVTGAAFLVAFLFHAQIFRFFVANEYASVSHLLPWMLLVGGIFSAGQTLALNLMTQMKTRAMMSAKIVTALLGVALNFAGAYWYGTTGIVIAGVLFSLTYFIWIVVLSKREVIEKCP